jgi:polyisoprenoid-binding protein YceI
VSVKAAIIVGFLLLFSLPAPAAATQAQKWNVSYNQGYLSFTGTQLGTPFKGMIQKYAADIRFDLQHPEKNRVVVDIDLSSLSTGDKDRDKAASAPAWFDLARFSTARLTADSFKRLNDKDWQGEGTLTIKNISAPVSLSFTLETVPGSNPVQARVKGSSTLDRSVFGLGTGEWKDTNIIANKVGVEFFLVAYAQK